MRSFTDLETSRVGNRFGDAVQGVGACGRGVVATVRAIRNTVRCIPRRAARPIISLVLGDVVDAELLLEATSGYEKGFADGREGDSTDDVSVLEGADAFAGLAVPDFAVKDQYRT